MLNETPTLAPDGLPYRLLTLRNSAGMVVTLMDWGATLLSARVPMPDGSVRETLLGLRIAGAVYRADCFSGRIHRPLR